MRTVGAFEAKTHFSRLLDDVEAGEVIIITRHGEPVAQLVPARASRDKTALRALVEETIRAAEGQDRGAQPGNTIKDLIEAGRK